MARVVDDDNYIGWLTQALLIDSKTLEFFLLSLSLQYVSHSPGRPVFGSQSAWETKYIFPRHFDLKWPENGQENHRDNK